MSSTTTTAIIYVTGGVEADRWRNECVRYCAAHGYDIAAVVTADGDRWDDVLAMVTEEGAEVIVVARADQLPPDRPGRIEVVAEQMSRHRRPTLRGGAGPPQRPSSAGR